MIRPDSAAVVPFRECLQQWLARGQGGGKRQKTQSIVSPAAEGGGAPPSAPPMATAAAAAAASKREHPCDDSLLQRPRAPLSELSGPAKTATGGKPTASLSFAEELAQKQRGGLRRAAMKGKENSGPCTKAPESLVLRRLRERRDLCG